MYPPKQNPVTLFSRELNREEPALDRLALYIAQIAHPDLDVNEYLTQIDELAEVVIAELRQTEPGYERAQQFLTIFNDGLKFHGNTHNYYEADNSFLNRVLTRRVGLPILLSLLCVTIGTRVRRAGLDVDLQGVGLPSHFMVRYSDGAGVWLMDPFYGKVLPPEDVTTYLSSLFKEYLNGRTLQLPADILRPVSPQMMLFRVLNNIRAVYLDAANYRLALRVMDYMLEIVSDDPHLWKERGLLNHHCDNLEQASRDLRRYFFLNDQWTTATGLLDEFDIEMPLVYLAKGDLLDQLSDEDFDPDLLDGATSEDDLIEAELFDVDTLENDETDEVDIIAWDMPADGTYPEFDDDLGEHEFVDLTDEEYRMVNVLSDIESLRISLN